VSRTPEASRASRIGPAFASRATATGLIPYLTAGYPSLERTLELLRAVERAGALAVEVGVPFSDPIADGPDIQRASEWALRQGVGVENVLDLIERFRRESSLPVVVMTYSNPVVRVGAGHFAERAREAGVDAVILSDLPPEELAETWRALDDAGIDTVLLVAPTTTAERLPVLLARCRGFVYCLSRTGVTGRSEGYAGSLDERLAAVRAHTRLPVAVGFGISSAADAAALRGRVDAVVVGAAFMRLVEQDPERGVVDRVGAFAGELVAALR
jgi:tryptophan synthase alpha chain